jgi:DNA-binding transcriptional LysR family regulator
MSYLPQLRTFLEAYRTGSITKAADLLHLTQPAASAHIKSLEAVMEKKLFIRHARGIKPTAIAEELARSIAPHLEQIEVKFNAACSRISAVAGAIHIASPAEFLDAKVLPAIASLLAHDIRVRVHVGGKERIYQLLDDAIVDLAITASPPQNKALDFIEIEQETLVLVATADWKQKYLLKPFEPQQLLILPAIAYDENLPLIRQYFAEVFQIQLKIQAAFTVADLRIVRSLVSLGQGYTVLPKYLCDQQLQANSLCLLHQTELHPSNNLYLVWHQSSLRHPRVVFVRDHLLESICGKNI